jgi:hypothetical protein
MHRESIAGGRREEAGRQAEGGGGADRKRVRNPGCV